MKVTLKSLQIGGIQNKLYFKISIVECGILSDISDYVSFQPNKIYKEPLISTILIIEINIVLLLNLIYTRIIAKQFKFVPVCYEFVLTP